MRRGHKRKDKTGALQEMNLSSFWNLSRAGNDFGLHICHLYKTPEEIKSSVEKFLSDAFVQDKKIIFMISDTDLRKNLVCDLTESLKGFSEFSRAVEIYDASKSLAPDESAEAGLNPFVRLLLHLERDALAQGFEGLKIIVQCSLKDNSWFEIMESESLMTGHLEEAKISLLCLFPLAQCDPSMIVDIVSSHQGTIMDRAGILEMITPSIPWNHSAREFQHSCSERASREQYDDYIPVCSYCRSMRSPKSWMSPEDYVNRRWHKDFTHSICPDCLRKVYENMKNEKIQEA